MSFSDYLVVTNDGKVGELLMKSFLDDEEIYITNIPNKTTTHTLYTNKNAELVKKSDLPKNF